jgi:hypothetical protein
MPQALMFDLSYHRRGDAVGRRLRAPAKRLAASSNELCLLK